MKREPNWAKAVPGQPEIKESYVEEVVTTEREVMRGRIERAVIITTRDSYVYRSAERHDRVNWRGHSYILDLVTIPRNLSAPVRDPDILRDYQKFEVTLVAYAEPEKRPFDYWNAPLSNGVNHKLWNVTDGRA